MEKIFFLVGSCNTLIHKCGFHGDVFVGNALITMYSRWEHLVDARQVFDEMRSRDWVSWSALITGYAQEGDHGLEAILVFNNGIQAISIKHLAFSFDKSGIQLRRYYFRSTPRHVCKAWGHSRVPKEFSMKHKVNSLGQR